MLVPLLVRPLEGGVGKSMTPAPFPSAPGSARELWHVKAEVANLPLQSPRGESPGLRMALSK